MQSPSPCTIGRCKAPRAVTASICATVSAAFARECDTPSGSSFTMRAEPAFLTTETIDTPIGALVLVVDESGTLVAAEFADVRDRLDRWLDRRLAAGGSALRAGRVPVAIKAGFAAYFDGDLKALDALPIRLGGTSFQNEVWTALRRIAPARTFGYGAFAERLGRPQAARA